MSNVSENVGENKEFTIVAKSDVEVFFNDADNTSANDTATKVYFDNDVYLGVKAFVLRPNQTVQIVSINGVVFTDPYTCIKDTSITEKLDTPSLFKMVIRTLTVNTHIKLRIR